MRQPFGYTLKFTLSLARPWLSLGPGWAVLAGALSTGYEEINLTAVLLLLGGWLLVDPVLGTAWDLWVQQGLGRTMAQVQLPSPPAAGFLLPYTQPESLARRLLRRGRSFQLWWKKYYWPIFGPQVTALALSLLLALIIGLWLGTTIFWLTVVAIGITLIAGPSSPDLTGPHGGRWQTIVQLLLPWLIGSWLWTQPTAFNLALLICYGAVFLGGLRMSRSHPRAELLFFGGQITAILGLLALHLLFAAAVLGVLFITQLIVKTSFNRPTVFLAKVQPYLVLGLLMASLGLGSR